MSPEELEKKFLDAQARYQTAKKQLDTLRGRELTKKQLATELAVFGGGGDVTTLNRMIEGRASKKENLLSKAVRTSNFMGIATRIECLIVSASPSVGNFREPPSTPACSTYHQFQIWYWDWTAKPANSPLKGDVVTGYIRLPTTWAGAGASLTLHDDSTLLGEVWAHQYGNQALNLNGRFWSAGRPDLSLSINIENKEKFDLLAGAFVTADTQDFGPMHGTFYLTHQMTTETELPVGKIGKGTKKRRKPTPTKIDDSLKNKIRQSLFQQTQVQKARQRDVLPDYIHILNETLDESFLNKTFIGYFFNTHTRQLEHFLLRIDQDARVQIQYERHESSSGRFRLYYKNVVQLDLDYDRVLSLFRYRMYFCEIPKSKWYRGVGVGSVNHYPHLFMNRVIIREIDPATDKVPNTPPSAIRLNEANQQDISNLFIEHPILKEYLSGAGDRYIDDNERLSETPDLLRRAGLLIDADETISVNKGTAMISGNYRLYSLARMTNPLDENDEKNETFSIERRPLHITQDGKALLKGKDNTYYGQAFCDGKKFIMRITRRERTKNDKPEVESVYLEFYLNIEPVKDNSEIDKYSYGTSNRFTNTRPEARYELMVRQPDQSFAAYEKDPFNEYEFFSKEWVEFKKEKSDVVNHFSGRVNRLIAPHKKGGKPKNRQPEFRQLFAHAAQNFLVNGPSDMFVTYFHQAMLHGFGSDELEDKPLYSKLIDHFRNVYDFEREQWTDEGHEILRIKADRLYAYLFPEEFS
ncbi:hypothetical protein [Spirosoma luteum]|uniref:hypothetical protein n=1 Tax=Spirosoma luteum TaxID=431553 RepID=UPI000370DFC1|nr:hypothetical protein [Spirosoma luteum]